MNRSYFTNSWLSLALASICLVLFDVDIGMWRKLSIISFFFKQYTYRLRHTFFDNFSICKWLSKYPCSMQRSLNKFSSFSYSVTQNLDCWFIFCPQILNFKFTKFVTVCWEFFGKLLAWSLIMTFNVKNVHNSLAINPTNRPCPWPAR